MWLTEVWAVAVKDIRCELRSRYAINAFVLFGIVTLASVSLAVGPAGVPPELAAALLWVVFFFSAMAGLARGFVQEHEGGTIQALRIYAAAQAVLWGKLLINVLLLWALALFLVPLFIMFLDVAVQEASLLFAVLLLGLLGMAGISTFVAALIASTQAKGALFTVLTFPVLLPHFLGCITLTTKALTGGEWSGAELLFLLGYDGAILGLTSVLFDYLWYE